MLLLWQYPLWDSRPLPVHILQGTMSLWPLPGGRTLESRSLHCMTGTALFSPPAMSHSYLSLQLIEEARNQWSHPVKPSDVPQGSISGPLLFTRCWIAPSAIIKTIFNLHGVSFSNCVYLIRVIFKWVFIEVLWSFYFLHLIHI